MYEERLRNMPPEMLEFKKHHQERLKIEVRKPTGLKIDDYYFGFPTLLDGAETAPPEDVGGIYGFYEILQAYSDPKHPEHREMKEWVEQLYFKEYDSDWINERLKGLNYKKTQWDKVNHDRYQIIEDKYRKK
jgi:hypothetical protein